MTLFSKLPPMSLMIIKSEWLVLPSIILSAILSLFKLSVSLIAAAAVLTADDSNAARKFLCDVVPWCADDDDDDNEDDDALLLLPFVE